MKRIAGWMVLIALGMTSVEAQTPLNQVNARAIVQNAGRLFVAKGDGGIGVYEAETGRFVRSIPTSRPIKTMKYIEGRLVWATEDSRVLYFTDPTINTVDSIELPSIYLRGTICRLSAWMGQIVVHSDSDFAFFDPATRTMSRPDAVLPPEICKVAQQGIVDSFSENGTGMFVSIRRLGDRKFNSEPDAIKQIGILTAWMGSSTQPMHLLGAYTTSLVDFKTVEGPQVQIKIGSKIIRNPYGTGEIGNVCLGSEGIVALGNRESITVPFFRSDWMPNRVKTAFWPRYSQQATFAQESVWWSDFGRVYRSDLDDGSSDAFIPKTSIGEIRSVVADDRGAWVATSTGVQRIDTENVGSSWTKISAGAATQASTHEQFRLIKEVEAQRATVSSFDGKSQLTRLIARAGGRMDAANWTAGKPVAEGELGDVVVDRGREGIYMGAGQVLMASPDGLSSQPLEAHEDVRFYRVLPRTAPTEEDMRPPMPVVPVAPRARPIRRRFEAVPSRPPVFEDAPIVPLGINRAKPSLGHSLFVRCAPGEAFDSPTLPSHQRLLEIAKGWIGTPYRWGGNTKEGVDCSGFVTAVYRELGIHLPRHSQDIGHVRFGQVVKDKLHFGDVLVFQSPKHCAIYIGNGRTIEAISGGVGYSTVYRRTQAIVRRFLF